VPVASLVQLLNAVYVNSGKISFVLNLFPGHCKQQWAASRLSAWELIQGEAGALSFSFFNSICLILCVRPEH